MSDNTDNNVKRMEQIQKLLTYNGRDHNRAYTFRDNEKSKIIESLTCYNEFDPETDIKIIENLMLGTEPKKFYYPPTNHFVENFQKYGRTNKYFIMWCSPTPKNDIWFVFDWTQSIGRYSLYVTVNDIHCHVAKKEHLDKLIMYRRFFHYMDIKHHKQIKCPTNNKKWSGMYSNELMERIFRYVWSDTVKDTVIDLSSIPLPHKRKYIEWIKQGQKEYCADKKIKLDEKFELEKPNKNVPNKFTSKFIQKFLTTDPEDMIFNDSSLKISFRDHGFNQVFEYRFQVALPGFNPCVTMQLEWEDNFWLNYRESYEYHIRIDNGTIVRPVTLNYVEKQLTKKYPNLKVILLQIFNQVVCDEAAMWLNKHHYQWWEGPFARCMVSWRDRLKPFDHSWATIKLCWSDVVRLGPGHKQSY